MCHIAVNPITSNLDDSLPSEAKVFQLTGNDSLEHLLQFFDTKMSRNALHVETYATAYNSSKTNAKPRIDKMESMMEKILEKLNNNEKSSAPGRENICGYCGKKGQSKERCFKKDVCQKCGNKRHIAKYCKKTRTPSASALAKSNISDPARSIMLTVENVNFLYDIGSQYSIVRRDEYKKLKSRPTLQPVSRRGTGENGSKFNFDGIAYMNISFFHAFLNPLNKFHALYVEERHNNRN